MNIKHKLLSLAALLSISTFAWAQDDGGSAAVPHIGGSVFGGGRMADVEDGTHVDVYKSAIGGSIFGGNDITGVVKGSRVTIYDHMNDTLEVYGGGNGDYVYSGKYSGMSAPVIANTSVIIGNATDTRDSIKIGKVFGGAKSAKVTGVAHVIVNSGLINQVFGGNNVGDTVSSTLLTINGSDSIHEAYGGGNKVDVLDSVKVIANGGHIHSLYGGNNEADLKAKRTIKRENNVDGSDLSDSITTGTHVLLNSGTLFVKNVYGGCRSADVENGTLVHLNAAGEGGYIGNIFGGCDLSGNVTTTNIVATYGKARTIYGGGNGDYDYVNENNGIDKPTVADSWIDMRANADTIYGGGKAANITHSTHVCLINTAQIGDSIGAVYGGCKSADVDHATHVLMISDSDSKPVVKGSVFGGCDFAGNVGECDSICLKEGVLNDSIHLAGEPTETTVPDYTFVKLLAGTVTGRVFGGGNGLYTYAEGVSAPACQNTYVLVKNATIGTADTIEVHSCFGGGQGELTRVMHNVYTMLGDTTTSVTTVNGILYGGSYAGIVNSSCDDVTKTILLGKGTNTHVLGDVYGGSYGNHVKGKISLNIKDIQMGEPVAIANIYAGNNNAGQPECEASINYVGNDCNIALYGGGNHAPFYGTTRLTFTKGEVGYLYGGGNHADVFGNTIVEVLGGRVCHDVFGGGNKGAVRVNTEVPGQPYGGNTLVIVRDDCLKLDGDNFASDPLTGNYFANRDNSSLESFYSKKFFGDKDPSAANKNFYVLTPNVSLKRSLISIGGNVYGGGNEADVEGKTAVIIGEK